MSVAFENVYHIYEEAVMFVFRWSGSWQPVSMGVDRARRFQGIEHSGAEFIYHGQGEFMVQLHICGCFDQQCDQCEQNVFDADCEHWTLSLRSASRSHTRTRVCLCGVCDYRYRSSASWRADGFRIWNWIGRRWRDDPTGHQASDDCRVPY